jgi:hypothetical protein
VKIWVLVGILILFELLVVVRIPIALFQGAVPLNPAGWLGYNEFLDVTVERKQSPATYWFVLLLVTALAVVFGAFIYLVAVSGGDHSIATAGP